MESTLVHIGDAAFQSLLIASIETFPSSYLRAKTKRGKPLKHHRVLSPEGESFGLLFGQRLHRPMKNQYIYNVTLAVPMQTAMRTKDSVNVSTLHFDRIRDVTESFPNLEFLGTFHSHPCPSKAYASTLTQTEPFMLIKTNP